MAAGPDDAELAPTLRAGARDADYASGDAAADSAAESAIAAAETQAAADVAAVATEPHPTSTRFTSYQDLLAAQLKQCGELCAYDESLFAGTNASTPHTVEYLVSKQIKRRVECAQLFSPEADAVFEADPLKWPPPRSPPDAMLGEFTLGHRVNVAREYNVATYQGGSALHPSWTMAVVDKMKASLLAGKLHGTYGERASNRLLEILRSNPQHIKDKRVLVIGSEKPWVETIALVAGAASVTTVEYGVIHSEVPEITTYTPKQLAEAIRHGKIEPFDAAITYSSLEHPGLGRYGDGLQPWGDVVAVAKASCQMKSGAALFLGLPISEDNRDVLVWNSHRLYGPWRLPLVLTNWRVKDVHRLPGFRIRHDVVVALNERE